MAFHKSAKKRIKTSEKKRLHNKYYAKTMRNAIKKFRSITDKKDATEKLPDITSLIDKVAKKSIIHKSKAGNLKSKLAKYANSIK